MRVGRRRAARACRKEPKQTLKSACNTQGEPGVEGHKHKHNRSLTTVKATLE